ARLGGRPPVGLARSIGRRRAVARLGQPPALAPARHKPWCDLDSMGFAPGPPAVIGAHFAAATRDGDGIRAELVELAQRPQLQNRTRADVEDLHRVGPVDVDVGGVAYVLPVGIGLRPAREINPHEAIENQGTGSLGEFLEPAPAREVLRREYLAQFFPLEHRLSLHPERVYPALPGLPQINS